jgi:outer membrane protein assembly factor BamB
VEVGLKALLTAALVTPLFLTAANWPQWRGPGSAAVSSETTLPEEWTPTKNIAWKTKLPGRGHSSPVIWGNRIFLTTAIEGDAVEGAKAPKHTYGGEDFVHPDAIGANKSHKFLAIALDRDSGKVVWERVVHDGRVYDDRHKKASYANPTAVTDGKTVYFYFGTEGLFAFDFKGKQLWKASPGPVKSIGLGVAASPVIDGYRLFLVCDQDSGDDSFLAAFDRRNGKELWRVERKARASWATPLVLESNGRKELVVNGAESVIAYDPASGKELWRSKGLLGHAIPSAVAGFGMVFVSAGYPEKRTFGIRLGGSGDISETPSVVWSYDKGSAYVPSPILYGDLLYVMTDSGLLTCLDARTGDRKYEGARVPKPARFTASPVGYNGKILLTSEEGETFMIKAGPVHEVLRTNSVGEAVYASPAVADGRLYIRAIDHLFCIREGVSD